MRTVNARLHGMVALRVQIHDSRKAIYKGISMTKALGGSHKNSNTKLVKVLELISQMIRISEIKWPAPPSSLSAILSPRYLGVGLSQGVRTSYRSQNMTFPFV